jgi:D-3-phosphoglycerate dehydrogenase
MGGAASGRPLVAVASSQFALHDRRPLEILEASGAEVRLNATGRRPTAAELIELAGDADGVIAGLERYDASSLPGLRRLRCISRIGVGLDNIDLDLARSNGVAVLTTPIAATGAVAELAAALVLALLRDLVRQDALVRRGEWRALESHLLRGRRLTIVGLGRIGRRIAEVLRPFEPDLAAVDPLADADWCAAHRVTRLDLDAGLRRAAVLVIAAAKDPDRPLRLAAAELAKLPRGAVLVNVARGGMVDEDALATALRDGHLAGAGLDVFEQEPYAGPLRDLPNVIMSPHAATSAVEARIEMEIESVENVLRSLSAYPSDR